MKKFLWVIPIVIIGIVGLILVFGPKSPAEDEISYGGVGLIPNSIVAYESQNTGEAIHDGRVYLDRIIVGKNVGGQLISVVDADTSTSLPAVFFQIEGSTLQGVYEIGANLTTGIWYTASADDNVTIIYVPME